MFTNNFIDCQRCSLQFRSQISLNIHDIIVHRIPKIKLARIDIEKGKFSYLIKDRLIECNKCFKKFEEESYLANYISGIH